MVILQQHRLESHTCLEAHMGLSRDSLHSWSSRSRLSFADGELPALGSQSLVVCFVAFTDVKALERSEQDHEGWPPNQYMFMYVFICFGLWQA